MESYQISPLWKKAFELKNDDFDEQRKFLISAYMEFRDRVAILVAQIHKDMPSLTVHDISHIDALWWTASEITGPDYPINPAEAFVLGGAFLLHDSAQCIAAYPRGIAEITSLPEWEFYCRTLELNPNHLIKGSDSFQQVLFEVLRSLHPKQARILARLSWNSPGDNHPLFLLPNDDLRRAYAEAIGIVAESHWHPPHQLENLSRQKITPPACLYPSPWTVDILKIALVLRTADAAHIDAQRAPRFLQALVKPSGFSLAHWNFQARLNNPKRDPDPARKELCLSGSSFPADEQQAWWLAYDTARMIDNELRTSDRINIDFNRPQFAVRSVANIHSTESFSYNVPTNGWHPIDTSFKISNIPKIIEQFGGFRLYGDSPRIALRELIQNARDAVHACRSLGALGDDEGSIDISIENTPQGDWLHIVDTGIGMSRYVLTNVLIDFGKSLWKSPELQGEWKSLTNSNFEAVGKFGIGFFSIFMLGEKVTVTTNRYEPKENEASHWVLEFSQGTEFRPILRSPTELEKLKRHGTKVSILLSNGKLDALTTRNTGVNEHIKLSLAEVCSSIAPALDINLFTKENQAPKNKTIQANDWKVIDNLSLLNRIAPEAKITKKSLSSIGPILEIHNDDGELIGRAAIDLQRYFRSDGLSSAGFYRGILSGKIEGVIGIIQTLPQEDLARRSAAPNISPSSLIQWANKQAEEILNSESDKVLSSSILASFGANYKQLYIGQIEGQDITYLKLLDICAKTETIYLHDGFIGHEDEDEILSKDFYNNYIYEEFVIEAETTRPPSWINTLNSEGALGTNTIKKIIKQALSESWESFNIEKSQLVKVATVLGKDIFRECDIYTRCK
ncbi:ATP-binding protein [Pseudomonas putida]|uniref:HD domain-containing protein n=1 Tax=Pseudomonas putida TaxID=303 RepID=UPI0009A2392A|nr:ATP-binding protein [Pseudomonas putida]